MSLHDSLRELVAVRGAGVVDEAEEFRGALDDFLAEDEATVGEINLLVDAVRLGAVRRVLDVLDHGAVPEAAVREAGAGLARDRGTDDPARSCWALAALCFALGKVDDELVRMFRADAGTVSAPQPPTAPHGRAPEAVAPPPGPSDGVHTPVLDEDPGSSRPTSATPPDLGPHSTSPKPTTPQPTPETEAVLPTGSPYLPPVVPEQRERSSRAGVFLLVVLVALILGGLVAAGFILLQSDDDDPAASDDTSDSGDPTRTKDPKKPEPLISDDEMLVPYQDGDNSRIYAVDAIDGGFRTVLTEGPNDVLPTLSPDRRTMTYLVGPAPLELYRFDLKASGWNPFFEEAGPCDHSGRPGWSLDGERVALVCTGDDKNADGIYIAGADGSDPQLVVDDPLVAGSPTWVSDTEFVFGRKDSDDDDARMSLWRGYADGRSAEPLDVGVSDAQITHVDWSPEAEKLLFLASPLGPDTEQVGSVWTVNADGSDPQVVANGLYAHPVWSPDGQSVGLTVVDLEAETEVLGYIDLDDPDAPDGVPHIVEDPPPGEVGIPVWGTR